VFSPEGSPTETPEGDKEQQNNLNNNAERLKNYSRSMLLPGLKFGHLMNTD